MEQLSHDEIAKWVGAKGKWLCFSLSMCGAYLKDGKVTFYHQFVGQGTDVNVLDKTYDKCVDLTDIIKDFTKNVHTKDETVDIVEKAINDMVNG